jgi:hypothetical protein
MYRVHSTARATFVMDTTPQEFAAFEREDGYDRQSNGDLEILTPSTR